MSRPFDLVLFGATGFTGRLVAEVLMRRAVGLRWALAGRNLQKLAEVAEGLGASDQLPLLHADAADEASLARLAGQASVVITTVGPYTRHGTPLVAACAAAGTDYLDLCGEPLWMAQMIREFDARAGASGARIVFSAGFDSVPFDLGVVFLQHHAQQRFGEPLQRVHGRVRTIKGGLSGGTAASALATFEQTGADPTLARRMADPFALTPGFRGPAQPNGDSALFDELADAWTGPFLMAPINTKNVHRTNALRGHPWGRDFQYDERVMTGSGPLGQRRARLLAGAAKAQAVLMGWGPVRSLIGRFALPQPGQGPGPRARERGHYELLFIGETATGRVLRATVAGEGDPGYGSTSRLIAEAALCLLQDVHRVMTPGGVWTAGAAMGLALQRRLQEHAGLRFALLDAA
jgi:short subunit dehydrogenase-like uncharacterized protein